jgi:hypothetical protein
MIEPCYPRHSGAPCNLKQISLAGKNGRLGTITQPLVLLEGIIISLVSWLSGVLLALPLSWILSDQLGVLLLGNPLKFSFFLYGLILWLIIALVLAIVA